MKSSVVRVVHRVEIPSKAQLFFFYCDDSRLTGRTNKTCHYVTCDRLSTLTLFPASTRGSSVVLSSLSPGGAEGAVGGEEDRAQRGKPPETTSLNLHAGSKYTGLLAITSPARPLCNASSTSTWAEAWRFSSDIYTFLSTSTGVPQKTQGRPEEAEVLPEELRIEVK